MNGFFKCAKIPVVTDIWDKQKRSEVMSRIRSRGNKTTEFRLIEVFKAHGITGWRRKQKLMGNPDFVFRKARVCVFVDGCFWHGCPKCYRHPKSNRRYWDEKYESNRARDRKVTRCLRADGWRVLRIWEHELARNEEAGLAARIRKRIFNPKRASVNRSATRDPECSQDPNQHN